jgi:GDP/GTP exchange factor required for growth at low temperature
VSTSNSRRSSVVSSVLEAGLGNTIQQWQVNALVDSISEDKDGGDVEDALCRLEGQMNPQRQHAKETKGNNLSPTFCGRGWIR